MRTRIRKDREKKARNQVFQHKLEWILEESQPLRDSYIVIKSS